MTDAFFRRISTVLKALEIVKAENNHELGVFRLAKWHFHVNTEEWIGEADSIKPVNRNRKALERKNVSRGSSVIDEMRWPRAEMKSVPTWLLGPNVLKAMRM